MSLRRRLALLLVAALVLVQGATMAVLYARTRTQIESEAQVRLGQAQLLFDQHLAELGDRLAESARILTLDFALREAVATDERATAVSALRGDWR